MPVTLTDTAAREIATIIEREGLDADVIRLRVGVKGGGCSGFSYLLDLTETENESDEIWQYDWELTANGATNGDGGGDGGGDGDEVQSHGRLNLKVICDPKSYLYLNGTSIDFRDEIMGRGFVFNNPNASSTCGCGSSFSA